MAVDGVVGIPGSGKSYFGVHEGLNRWVTGYKRARDAHHRLLKMSSGLDPDPILNMPSVDSYQGLAANFDFDLVAVARYLTYRQGLTWRESVVLASTIKTIRTIQDLLDLWNTHVIFDEAQLWFNARDYALMPQEVISFWTQHRKGGIDLLLITQAWSMIDSNIRGVTANVWRARPVPWTLKLFRLLAGRVGLVRNSTRPVFRYTSIMDEAEGTVKSVRVKGMSEAMSRVRSIVLDPLVAACYATTGQFYAPSADIHAAAATTKHRVTSTLNLSYDLTRFRRNRQGWQPQVPGLDIRRLAEAYMLGLDVPDIVAALQAEHYDQVVPADRWRAAWPTPEATRAASDSGTIGDAGTPKENPPAVTGGERGAPPQYSGGWKKRGASA